MLKIVTGALRTEKFDIMLKHIKESIKLEKTVYIIVPDQFSFEYDKKLYKLLGANCFNSLKIVSFKRISEEIIKKNGSVSGEYADDNTKQIMMYLAIKMLKSEKTSKFYKKQLDKPNFITNSLELVKEFRQASITPEEFEAVTYSVKGSLSEKVYDINQIYSNYCNVLKEKDLKDSLTSISEAAEIAKEANYFSGFDVFIDEFNGFSYDELRMIDVIISQASNAFISLTINEQKDFIAKLSPFSNVIKTQQALINLAMQYNLKVEFEKCTDFSQYKSKEIEHINNNIFNPVNKKSKTHENVEVISAIDLYEEAEIVATEIKKLVCDFGYKYSEIAVVSRQLSDYSGVIPGVFDRYEIPYFMDAKQSVSQKALILYILSIFEVTTTKTYNMESILRYIKSTLSGFNDFDISRIEDYCYQWNVKGNMWLSDFTAQDNSLAKREKTSDKMNYLDKLNELRRKIIEPLEKFKNVSKNATAGEICEAFYKLLDEISVTKAISKCIQSGIDNTITNESEIVEIGREFKQLWRILTQAVKSIYENIGDDYISLKDFYELLKLMLSQTAVANPPQKLDAVTVASAERSKLADPKVVFVIGVNEGIMPKKVKETGLFTDKDKEMLDKVGIKVSKTLLWKIAEERFIAYQALSSPSEKLFVTYPTSSLTGEARRPSPVVNQMEKMFGDSISLQASGKNPAYYCTTSHATYYKYIENFNSFTTQTQSMKAVLNGINEYKSKIEYLEKASESTDFKLSESNSKALFFSHNLNISATRIEDYNKCPFSYFCKYGLNLRPVNAIDINPLSKGTIVHHCLENIMSIINESGEKVYNPKFTEFSDDKIKSEVSSLLNTYKQNELGGDFGKTKRFKSLFNSLNDMIFEVVKNIQNEFRQSKFTPTDFELNLSDKNGKSMLEIDLQNGIKVCIHGKIDRVDIFEKDEKKYVRIVDYKTGDKDLLFEELYHGLNLQMILYLVALTKENGTYEKYSNGKPAGILYMPAKYLTPKIERAFGNKLSEDDIEIKVQAEKLKNFKMKGLIVDIEESFEAMEKELRGQYIPVERKLNGDLKASSKVIGAEAFAKLQDFAKEKVIEMASDLRCGKIEAIPTGSNKLPCEYCDYWAVCGHYKTNKGTIIGKSDAEKLKDIIEAKADKKAGETDE